LLATPTHTYTYQKRSIFRTTLEQLEAFHQDPAALKKLTPPPIFIQVHADHRTPLTDVDLRWYSVANIVFVPPSADAAIGGELVYLGL
jgi:ligand-binding SRPBCC domain-containing protein